MKNILLLTHKHKINEIIRACSNSLLFLPIFLLGVVHQKKRSTYSHSWRPHVYIRRKISGNYCCKYWTNRRNMNVDSRKWKEIPTNLFSVSLADTVDIVIFAYILRLPHINKFTLKSIPILLIQCILKILHTESLQLRRASTNWSNWNYIFKTHWTISRQ